MIRKTAARKVGEDRRGEGGKDRGNSANKLAAKRIDCRRDHFSLGSEKPAARDREKARETCAGAICI